MSQIQSTYKSAETEELLDIWFYRPVGYVMALGGRLAGLTPNFMTLIGSLVGIIGGHLLYYDVPGINAGGVLLLIVSEAMDSADGQLARLTGNFSRNGRILDGIGDNVKFVSIYFHLTLRLIGNSGDWWIFGIALLSGFSHSTQSAIADYFRSCYQHFVVDRHAADIEMPEIVEARYRALTWRRNFADKITVLLYRNYTRQQNMFVTPHRTLYLRTDALYGTTMPEWIRDLYCRLHRSQVKYYNILTTNTRLIVLFIAIFTRALWLYFAFELTIMNLLLVYVVLRQRFTVRIMLTELDRRRKEDPL